MRIAIYDIGHARQPTSREGLRDIPHGKARHALTAELKRSPTSFRLDTFKCIDDSFECHMNAITIQQTLLECGGEARVVLANDANERPLMGLSLALGADQPPTFVQIDRVTMLELQRGTVDLKTVLADRCAGIALGG